MLKPAILKPVGLTRTDGKRPDGITLMPWQQGKPLLWDATCVHRLCTAYHDVALQDGASAADRAKQRKLNKYRELAQSNIVMPLGFETLGGMAILFGLSLIKYFQEYENSQVYFCHSHAL